MVLHHITEGTGLIIVATAFFNSQLFSKGNLNIINVLAVPDIFKQQISKADCKNLLNHFLAQIVVNAENLFFVKGCQ